MKRLDRIAAKVTAAVTMKDVLKNLADLDDLSDNIEDMVGMFGRHFKVAARMDTDVDSQLELLKKARNGLEAAKNTQKYLEEVLKEYPDDKTALRAIKDAMAMVKRFEKHEKDARKVISIISKKEMPPALVKFASSVARALRAKLEDPKSLKVIPWQQKTRGGIEYQMVVVVPVPGHHILNISRDEWRVELVESTDSADGPMVKFGWNLEKATTREVAKRMTNALSGWPGLKGEESAIAAREEIAKGVASALNSAIARMRGFDDSKAEISDGNTRIEASYRSNYLPKEGAQDVGSDSYYHMVQEEIDRFKKQVEPLLKPFAKAIKDVYYDDSEKSWVYVQVGLK